MYQPWKKISESESETIAIGSKIIRELPKEVNLIILKGNIASGKTTLVKGIAKELGVNKEITSPTYGYKKVYDKFVHYDLYLIKKIKSRELLSLIWEELENGLVIVEWGDKIPKIKNSAIILIESISSNVRKIEVKLN